MAKNKRKSDNLYQKNLVLGKKPDGTYYRKTVYAKTRRELDQKIAAITNQLNNGIQVWENTITFKELTDIWMNQYNFSPGASWRYRQEGIIKNHLLPMLGEMRVCDLRQLHLQTIISQLAKKGYATATMRQIKEIAASILGVAVGSDLIVRNPFSDVKVPVKEPKERRALTKEEIALITENWQGHRIGLMAMIMLYAGLRRGEAMALEWEDIDFQNKVIKVTKACQSLKNVCTIKEPKSKAGIRDVPIPNILLMALIKCRKQRGFVCTNAGGTMLTDSSFMRSWEAFCNYLNVCAGGRNGAGPYLPHIQVLDRITAHMLRHTYATMLFDADVDVKSAQKFLGHADIEVTLKIYTHLTKFKEEKAIAALNAHLDSMTGNVSEKSGAS